MKMRSIFNNTVIVLSILLLGHAGSAYATSTITINSAGGGVFVIQGVGVEGAAALDITVQYDLTSLSNPRFAGGALIAGAMTAVNPNVPGTVRIAVIRLTPISGSGVIATLTFDMTGSSAGRILSLSAKLANVTGATLATATQVNNPPDATTASSAPESQTTPPSTSTSGQTASSGTAGTPSIIAPTVSIAAPPGKTDEGQGAPDAQGAKIQETQQALAETGRKSVNEPTVASRDSSIAPDSKEAAVAPARKIFAQKSILELFRSYKGERTATVCVSLFEQGSFIGFRQEPPIALSDGKSPVKVVFITTPGEKTTDDLTVTGARLDSLKKDPDNTNTWIAELIPEKGAYQASLAVSQGELKMVYPLTIAPKLALKPKGAGRMTKDDFQGMLNDRRMKRAQAGPKGGGQQDYLDDYIVTANYLDAVNNAHRR